MARRQYAGAAAQTSVNGSITSSQTSITVADGSTYPDGSVGPFSIVIDKGLAGEEKVLVTTRSVNTLNGCTRGYDGTAQSAHNNGATVNHCGTAIDFDEANAHHNLNAGVHGVTGNVVGTTDTQTLSGKTLTAPTINAATETGSTLDATSTLGGVSGTTLAADRSAWTSYTPTFQGMTLGNGTVTAAYRVVGKTLFLRIFVQIGTTTSYSGTVFVGLPGSFVAIGSANLPEQSIPFKVYTSGTTNFTGLAFVGGAAGLINLYFPAATNTSAQTALSNTNQIPSGGNFNLVGVIEVQ